jgi:mycothiol synthase
MRRLEIRREMSEDDVAEVQRLLDAAERADGHRPLSDHLWLDLVHGGREGFAGLVALEPGHDHPVGYAQLTRSQESWALELVIHPHHRYDAAAIGPELLDAAADVVTSEGGGHVHWWVFEPTAAHDALALRIGLHPGRRLYQMRRPLPVEPALDPPPRLVTRPFQVGDDDDAWLEVNNRAFHWHPEQGGWDLDTLRARQKEPWFDPAGFLMVDDIAPDGSRQLAGFCWTKVHSDHTPVLGEIYVIAVDPSAHGRGLGRALTLAGLAHLAEVGAPMGMLYVDAENTAAVTLYRSLGFEVFRTDRAYVGDLATRSAS